MSIVKTTHVHRPTGVAPRWVVIARCLLSNRTVCQCGTAGWYCMEHGHWHWVGDLGD